MVAIAAALIATGGGAVYAQPAASNPPRVDQLELPAQPSPTQPVAPDDPELSSKTAEPDPDWKPTENPKATVVPGQMRSDREEIPAPFTKEDADRAETLEAALIQQQSARSISALAAPVCQYYWPSPYAVCDEIRDKYNSLGGPASFLSFPSSGNIVNPDGIGQRVTFLNGPIYWSPQGGAHPVVNSFLNRWGIHGYEAGWLKYPTTDEILLPDGGRHQEFEFGAIYVAFQNAIGSAISNGPIRDKWDLLGGTAPGGSTLGYLIQDEVPLPDGQGRMVRFERGVIYWHPSHGAYSVRGDILDQWSLSGYEASGYGYPTGEPVDDGTGWFTQTFTGGPISGEIRVEIPPAPVQYIEFGSREEAVAYFDSIEDGEQFPGPQSRNGGGVTYGPCKLEPRYLHWRTKSGPSDFGIIGFKPYTTCTMPVSSITHEVDLRYEYYTWWPTAMSVVDSSPGSGNVYSLETTDLAFYCTGKVNTLFGGMALGTIEYMGKTLYARVYPPKKKFDCEV